ncbi:hypothetical protein [Streptomyces noursei]|uniref:hypothetical protein n=1 Tax=Streptomyces noursei TaxID=1971 RepID=UPI001F04A64A|nr:hypothetical protein [Streptomyces noursei]
MGRQVTLGQAYAASDGRLPLVFSSIEDPKGVLQEGPLKKDQTYQGEIGESGQTVEVVVGRQGWWNHTSLNNT